MSRTDMYRRTILGTSLAATGAFMVTKLIGHDGPPLTWQDDFSGAAGSSPGPVWSSVVDGGGGGNRELQYYIPAANALDGHGDLAITAQRNDGTYHAWYGPSRFTSGKLWTRQKLAFRYGTLQVRASFPCAGRPGAWPAIWLLGTNLGAVGWPRCGEIDMMESFGRNADARQVSAAAHWLGGNASSLHELPAGNDAADFHTYTLDWLPGSLSFSIDGDEHLTLSKKQVGANWPFDQPFFLILNLAIGGTMGGNVPATATFPYVMKVRSVALYGGELYTGSGSTR
jgi:beta-glucanase (GH16 family)